MVNRPRELVNKEGQRVDEWISLGRENSSDLLSELGTGGDLNLKDWVGGLLEWKSTERDNYKGGHFGVR